MLLVCHRRLPKAGADCLGSGSIRAERHLRLFLLSHVAMSAGLTHNVVDLLWHCCSRLLLLR